MTEPAETEPKLAVPKFRKLNPDELNLRLLKHYASLVDIAHGICDHFAADAHNEEGHPLNPCAKCVKTVRHVLEGWALIMTAHGGNAKRRQKQKDVSVFVTLEHAYRIGQAVLDPDAAWAMEGYGPL